MLDLVLNVLPEDSKESQTARILLYKLFYDQTDLGLTHFLLNLLKSFDAHKQAKRLPPRSLLTQTIIKFFFYYTTSEIFKSGIKEFLRHLIQKSTMNVIGQRT